MTTTEHEVDLLEHIARSAVSVHQRDLARVAGLSLGMTNVVVKRLVQKGWLTIRKINNRNIRYAVSPAGIEAISRRSYRYLRRTIRSIVEYRVAIEKFVQDVTKRGYRSLLLVGGSDLGFIVENACRKHGLRFVQDDLLAASARDPRSGIFTLYAEGILPESEESIARLGVDFLRVILAERETSSRQIDAIDAGRHDPESEWGVRGNPEKFSTAGP